MSLPVYCRLFFLYQYGLAQHPDPSTQRRLFVPFSQIELKVLKTVYFFHFQRCYRNAVINLINNTFQVLAGGVNGGDGRVSLRWSKSVNALQAKAFSARWSCQEK